MCSLEHQREYQSSLHSSVDFRVIFHERVLVFEYVSNVGVGDLRLGRALSTPPHSLKGFTTKVHREHVSVAPVEQADGTVQLRATRLGANQLSIVRLPAAAAAGLVAVDSGGIVSMPADHADVVDKQDELQEFPDGFVSLERNESADLGVGDVLVLQVDPACCFAVTHGFRRVGGSKRSRDNDDSQSGNKMARN